MSFRAFEIGCQSQTATYKSHGKTDKRVVTLYRPHENKRNEVHVVWENNVMQFNFFLQGFTITANANVEHGVEE